MKSFNKFSFFLLAVAASSILPEVSAFSAALEKKKLRHDRPLAMADDDDEPFSYFQMQQLPVATTTSRLDRFVECAEESGECDVTEMQEMIEGE